MDCGLTMAVCKSSSLASNGIMTDEVLIIWKEAVKT
jgi:hypothetical protein